MTDHHPPLCTAFAGNQLLASGSREEVALAIWQGGRSGSAEPLLIFDDNTGRSIDLDLRGSEQDIRQRYTHKPPPRRRGRPKLGVVAREVTLLPRHWEWLAAQPGSASVTLRKLVEQARRAQGGQAGRSAAHERAYHFMSAMAGNLPGFEEASRALFADDMARLRKLSADWPRDIRRHTLKLVDSDNQSAH